MEGLPFLPGNSFQNPSKSQFHRSQTLGYKNGYSVPRRPELGIGGVPLQINQLSEAELDELMNFKPTLTYGQAKQAAPEGFVPAFVAFDKKVLRFKAWYQQSVHESPLEQHRVRHVDIFYYLEDDSIAVVEPHIENSGLPQGKLLKRQRLPKNDVGDHWTWKDINIGMDVTFYGRSFHIYDSDKWTKDWLESEGIEVNPAEGYPTDPYSESRKKAEALKTSKTPSDFDKLKRFLEMDRKVLRFFCVWDDRERMFGEMRQYILHYYLVDDTLEVREVHTPNDGHDPFPVLINRQRVPRDRYNVQPTFPAIILELSENEIKEYFTPRDFDVGHTVEIYNRKFLIYDCDDFTKAFYWKNFGKTDFTPVKIEKNGPTQQPDVCPADTPPYTGYGSLEDSMQSCQTLIPQAPKKDFIKMLDNDGVVLRFEAVMDSTRPEDKGRRFILSFRLSDDMITIYEPPVRNSGLIGGKFLERTRVAKPGSTSERPSYYGPQDLYVGATISVFKHRFVITNADAFVLNYMEQHAEHFSRDAIETLRQRIGELSTGTHQMKGGPIRSNRTGAPGELEYLVREVKGQLKRLAITANTRKDQLFLGVDVGRSGYVSKQNLRDMCIKQQLPCDDDIIDALALQIGSDPDRITLEELRRFVEDS